MATEQKYLGLSLIKPGREVHESTTNEAVKKALGQFSTKCPECGKDSAAWKIDVDKRKDPPIVEHGSLHLVRYKCECQEVFKKWEEAED